jgi:hypothetical protein
VPFSILPGTIGVDHWGQLNTFDSAEKPLMFKKQHLKTPPKMSTSGENVAYKQT